MITHPSSLLIAKQDLRLVLMLAIDQLLQRVHEERERGLEVHAVCRKDYVESGKAYRQMFTPGQNAHQENETSR